jgi:hypothetical protein
MSANVKNTLLQESIENINEHTSDVKSIIVASTNTKHTIVTGHECGHIQAVYERAHVSVCGGGELSMCVCAH